MTAYYNERDPYAAQWLRNLIAAGHIAPGEVDERSIEDICPDDIRSFSQCHFFAGIGVWSYALRRAGWPDDRPIWTGSCPCQPFSAAGKRVGVDDERHLWPAWFHLISQLGPSVVVGEQVASKDGLGWLDLVSTDMEGAGYAFGASDLCAAGFRGGHLRQRLYFVGLADAGCTTRRDDAGSTLSDEETNGRARRLGSEPGSDYGHSGHGATCGLADADNRQRRGLAISGPRNECDGEATGRFEGDRGAQPCGAASGLAVTPSAGEGRRGLHRPREGDIANAGGASNQPVRPGDLSGLADALPARRPERGVGAGGRPVTGRGTDGGLADAASGHPGAERERGGGEFGLQPGGGSGNEDAAIRDQGEIDPYWRNVDWLLCRNPAGEPSWRPVEPGAFPLAHGIASRMGKLRAFGNALDAETATGFAEVVLSLAPEY